MKITRRPTGSPLWRQVIDKTPEKKAVVFNEKEGSKKLDRKSADQFDSYPRYNPNQDIREKFNKLFPAVETKKTADDVIEESSLTTTNMKTP